MNDNRFSNNSTWWVILGVKRSTPMAIVKEAYYLLANHYHPDKTTGNTKIMQLVNNAFEQAKREKQESNGYANTQDDTANSSTPKDEPIDFRAYRSSDVTNITDSDFWDNNLEFCANWQAVLKEFIYLPNPEIQFPILSAIAMQPSAMAHQNLPIVFLSGNPGTGKTKILELLSYPHRTTLISASSTYASIRDRITVNKFGNKAGSGRERNTVLLFDNVLPETLDDAKLYGLFLGAYDRTSSRIIISGGSDTNLPLEFDTFGLAVISTVVDIERNTKYPELQRRLLPLFTTTAPLDNELGVTGDYSFQGIPELYTKFWSNPQLLEFYVATRRKIRAIFKKDGRLSTLRYPLIQELIATGVTCQIWADIPQAINNFVELFDLYKTYIRKSPLEETLQLIIDNHGKIYNGGDKPDKLLPKDIADELTNCVRERLIDSRDITPKEIHRIMVSHGYELKNRKWKLMY